jgi:hypothetical protein
MQLPYRSTVNRGNTCPPVNIMNMEMVEKQMMCCVNWCRNFIGDISKQWQFPSHYHNMGAKFQWVG